jgi:hypothetical protein
MFVREKRIGPYSYLYLVESVRENGKSKQRIIHTLGLREGDKALVGNSAYRRYLKTPDAKHFTIDEVRVAEDARYDGLYVLRTNTKLDPLHAMLRYRELLVVERLFRTTKDLLATRPIYHQTDAAIVSAWPAPYCAEARDT